MKHIVCILVCIVAVYGKARKWESDNSFTDYDYNGFKRGEPNFDEGQYAKLAAQNKNDWKDVYGDDYDSNEIWNKDDETSGWFSDDEDDEVDYYSDEYSDESLSEEVKRNEEFLYDMDDDLTEDEKMIDELEDKVQSMQQTVKKYGRLKKKVHRMEKAIKSMQNMIFANREMAEYKNTYAKDDDWNKK